MKAIAVCALLLTMAAAPAAAISPAPLRVMMSLDFAVGKSYLAAGTYELVQGPNAQTLRLRAVGGRSSVLLPVRGATVTKDDSSALLFRVIQGRHFLAGVLHRNELREIPAPDPNRNLFLATLRSVPLTR